MITKEYLTTDPSKNLVKNNADIPTTIQVKETVATGSLVGDVQ